MKHGLQLLSILIAALFTLLLPVLYAEQVSGATDSLKSSETKSWKPQAHCPVMGGTINKKIYSDFAGQRIYFCCKECVAEFSKDPSKYLKKLELLGESTELSPVKTQNKAPKGMLHEHGKGDSHIHKCPAM